MEQIIDFFQKLFGVTDFPARWRCGRWTEFHGWLYIISDIAIFGAYLAIPILLTYFIVRRKDIPLTPIFWLFAAFILFCGATHLMDAATFWWPAYRFNGLLRLGTAMVSWITVFALIKAVPEALTFKSPTELQGIIDRQTDALKKSNEELEQFSYTVSHDLKSPLSNIMLSAEMVKHELEDKTDEDSRRMLDIIENNASKMSALITHILEFSRLGRQEMEMLPVDMNELVKEISEGLKMENGGRNLRFEIERLHGCSGNKVMVQRVVSNLLSNAVKYTSHKNEAVISVDSKPVNDFIEYRVNDNGEGIAPKHQEAVFQMFRRFSKSHHDGTGLGLAIARKIVEQHGGTIWVESQPGEGATFYFTLPCV